MSRPEEPILRALARGVRPMATTFDVAALRAMAKYHRVAPLIIDRWQDAPVGAVATIVDALRPVAAAEAARDMHQVAALCDTLDVCDALGVRCLVLKGAAFGPLLYGRSEVRPRLDVDVWVDGWEAVDAVAEALASCGFAATHQLPGRLSRHAISLERRHRSAAVAVDLHARCSRRLRVASAIEFDAAWRNATTFELNGHTVRTPGPRDALLHCALHLSSHHAGHALPWIHLEDLTRLVMRIDHEDWEVILDRLGEHALASAFTEAIVRLGSWSPGAVGEWVLDALDALAPDASARFDDDVTAILDDLDQLSAPRAARYLAELAFPPGEYLRSHYGTSRDRPTPLLWGWRILTGARRRLRGG